MGIGGGATGGAQPRHSPAPRRGAQRTTPRRAGVYRGNLAYRGGFALKWDLQSVIPGNSSPSPPRRGPAAPPGPTPRRLPIRPDRPGPGWVLAAPRAGAVAAARARRGWRDIGKLGRGTVRNRRAAGVEINVRFTSRQLGGAGSGPGRWLS